MVTILLYRSRIMGRHDEWRKLAKKAMRKRKRCLKAQQRDKRLKEEEQRRIHSPTYKKWLVEQQQLEQFQEEEEKKISQKQHDEWLREEELAQERWRKQQRKLERIKAEKAKQELIIREEWEREQKKLQEEAEARELEKERKIRQETELQEQIERYVAGDIESLPSSVRTVNETNPGATNCPFFAKVAACRFRDACSRNHIRPSVSRTLLFPAFYSHFRMDQVNKFNEYDTDVGLEYEDREIYDHFREFFNDVLPELKTFGRVVQFKVCRNEEPHLRGNVYVQYSKERYAIKAFRALQGRYYGGKRMAVEFCTIPSWKEAICGLLTKKKCPKGSKCNFLHVFLNPTREFNDADRDRFNDAEKIKTTREKDDWRWSPSPERIHDRDARSEFKENESERRSERRNEKSHRRSSERRNRRRSGSEQRQSSRKHRSPSEKRARKRKKESSSRSRSRSVSKREADWS